MLLCWEAQREFQFYLFYDIEIPAFGALVDLSQEGFARSRAFLQPKSLHAASAKIRRFGFPPCLRRAALSTLPAGYRISESGMIRLPTAEVLGSCTRMRSVTVPAIGSTDF